MIQTLILRVMQLYHLSPGDAAALVMSDPGEGSIMTSVGWRSPICDSTLQGMIRIESGCSAEVASETIHRLRGRVPIRTIAQAWKLGEPRDAPCVRIVGRRPGGYYLLANRRGWSRFVNQRRDNYMHFLRPLQEALRGVNEWYAAPMQPARSREILAVSEEALGLRGPEFLDRVRLRRGIDGHPAGTVGIVSRDFHRDGPVDSLDVVVTLLGSGSPADLVAAGPEDLEIVERCWLAG